MTAVRRVLRSLAVAALVALPLGSLLPAHASAHPLGNFTINHYAEVRVGERRIQLDVVIDMAEIPTFTERTALDTNHDGQVSASELAGARMGRCTDLATSLRLTVDRATASLRPTAGGLELLPGAGGLSTLRVVCEYQADTAPAAGPSTVSFRDDSYAERIGWREIVVTGDGVTVSATGAETATLSSRLMAYPKSLIVQPPDERAVTISAVPGGPPSGQLTVTDAQPFRGGATPPGAVSSFAGAVPGGVGNELSDLIGARDLTPIAIALSLLIAVGLGAVHAVSPGHGKTVMAAYLVGTRGRARHAVGLAMAVTVSHTFGVLVLAGVTLLASDLIPPERLYPVLGLASGITVVAIGAWLLLARWRELILRRSAGAHAHGPEPHDHELDRDHDHHDHDHDHDLEHRHGPFRHRHGPEPERSLSWRSLVAIGLAGGLVPSASALILLLGAIAAGRPAFGLALAVAFGVGMAVVLGGIGLVLARAGQFVERAAGGHRFARIAPIVPWVTGVVVLGAGFILVGQALVQRF